MSDVQTAVRARTETRLAVEEFVYREVSARIAPDGAITPVVTRPYCGRWMPTPTAPA